MGIPVRCALGAVWRMRGADVLAFFGAVVVHESGHLLVALLCGVPVQRLRAGIFGFRLSMAYDKVSYGRELCVLLAGSGAGFLAAWISHLCGWEDAVYYHLTLGGCNLLPIHGLDGGAVAETVCSLCFLPDTACRVSHALSFCTVLALWIAVLWICLRVEVNFGLLLAALAFLYGHMCDVHLR